MKNDLEKIKKWLKKYRIENYEIVEDLEYGYVVNVNGAVLIRSKKLKSLPFQFGVVTGYFDCNNNQLTSFKGFPKEALSVLASDNEFENTDHITKKIHKNIFLYNCYKLKALTDLPDFIGGTIYIDVDAAHSDFQSNFKEIYMMKNQSGITAITNSLSQKLKLNNFLNEKIKNNPSSVKLKKI